MNESQARESMVKLGRSLFERGYTNGTSGNLSVVLDDGLLITPTNSSLGDLDPAKISRLSAAGEHLSGDPPSKEAFLHQSVYRVRPRDRAIVHLHSTYSVAVSCLTDIDPVNVLPPITAYYVMRVGKLPLIRYLPPGDRTLAGEVEQACRESRAVLLANHGPVLAAGDLPSAVASMEELEETARLYLLLKNHQTRYLTPEQCSELQKRFPSS